MVHFVGAGCGAADLITIRGVALIKEADVIIYAGSLINTEILGYCTKDAVKYDSSLLTLEEVVDIIKKVHSHDPKVSVVRLHSGEISLYSSMREQIDELNKLGISWDITPGISAAFGAAASLAMEYTVPGISQSLIITRMEGKTPVPARESIESMAAHRASMAIYLSSGLTERLQEALVKGGYPEDTPAAIVYKATWPQEQRFYCTVGTIHKCAIDNNITKTAIILVGDAINVKDYRRSCLYDPEFSTQFREAKGTNEGS